MVSPTRSVGARISATSTDFCRSARSTVGDGPSTSSIAISGAACWKALSTRGR